MPCQSSNRITPTKLCLGARINSAIFDLAQVDAMFPLIEKTASVLDFLGLKNTDSSVFSSLLAYGQKKSLQEKIQELGLKENHLRYLGQDIEVGVWYAKLWSQYQFNGRARRWDFCNLWRK
mmetsp:Transcript_7033/g.14641  ORF Transcript_7033/g.14641 Transcript_7033/m.14641 type:complete len:121 (+) Transcript_7033:148-510(+)